MKLDTRILTMVSVALVLACGVPQTLFGQEQEKKETQSAWKLSELSLDDLLNIQVTTVSKQAEKTMDAPGIVQTITSEEIKTFGANSLSDILQRATSLQPLTTSNFPQQFSSIRGDLRSNQDNSVLLLLNGRPVREEILGGTDEIFYTAFPIEMIDRIEIVRGPGSVLYGSNAFVGVINVITKSENKSTLKASATEGSFGTQLVALTGSVATGDLKVNVSAKLDNIDGWNFTAMTKRPKFPDAGVNFDMGQKNLGIIGDIGYKNLRLLLYYADVTHDKFGVLPYSSFAGLTNKFKDFVMNLGYNYKFSESWEATANVTSNSEDLEMQVGNPIPDHLKAVAYLGELTVNGTISDKVNVVFGGVYETRDKDDLDPTNVLPIYHQKTMSGYFQGDYRPVAALKLIAGGQLNKSEGLQWDFVPRLGAIYDFTQEFGVKVLYGKAYRSPYPQETSTNNVATQGNPNVLPEKIGTLDLQVFYSGKSSEVSATFFNSNYTNSIAKLPSVTNPLVSSYYNQGELSVSGFELEGKVTLASNVFVTGSATYQKNKEDILVTPKFMGKIGVMYNTDFGMKVGLFNTYFGAPKENTAPKVNPAANAVNLLSANISYKLPIKLPLELSVYAQNIFDVKYYFTEFNKNWINTFPMGPGRAVYGKVSVSL